MSNFTFGHNVFKSRLLLLSQNVSAGGNGLNHLRTCSRLTKIDNESLAVTTSIECSLMSLRYVGRSEALGVTTVALRLSLGGFTIIGSHITIHGHYSKYYLTLSNIQTLSDASATEEC